MLEVARRSGLWTVVLAALIAAPTVAFAADGAETTPVNPFWILGGVVVAYLLAYLSLGWLTRRYGFVTGAQYVLVGMLVVPFTGWLDTETFRGVEALMAIAVGAVGLTAGLAVNRQRLKDQQGRRVRLALTVAGVTLLLVTVVPLLAVFQWMPEDGRTPWVAGLMILGAVALVADGRQLEALAGFFEVDEAAVSDALELCWLSTSLALLWFGVSFSVLDPGIEIFGGPADGGAWLAIHLLVGAVIGAVGAALIEERPDDDRALTILIGVVVTASATAYATGLSIVFVSFVTGVVLIQLSSEALRLKTMVQGAHVPIYILLLFVAGTFWTTGMEPVGYGIVAAYLVLRWLGRVLGVALYRPRLTGHRPPPGVHRTLWAPGALTAAIVLDVAIGFSEVEHIGTLVSALILILIAEEVIAYALSRGWMIDISDVGTGRQTSSPWGDWRGGQR